MNGKGKKQDWVSDLVDSGLTGHKPTGKFKHRHRYKYCENGDEFCHCETADQFCICGEMRS